MSSDYIVLSRRYRPKDLKDLIGQDVLSSSLKSCLNSKKVPHAFLFFGIRGVGKTTTARILARCLSCVGEDGKSDITSSPCGICKSCLAIDKEQHLDIMEFDAASRTGIDDIREIIDAAQYMPILGRYKIFIIDEVHMLSKSAFNALLKTLEEPPGHAKFIFATTEINKVPETILSRCMTFHLKPVSYEAISTHLISIATKEGYSLEKDAADIIASESEGSVRDSLSILEQAIMLSFETKVIDSDQVINMLGGARNSDIQELLNFILTADTQNALLKSEGLIKNGSDPFVLYKNIQLVLYKLIADKITNGISIKYSLSNLLYLWQIFLKQCENMKYSPYPEYVLNATVVILAYTASFPEIGNLIIKDNQDTNGNPNYGKKQTNLATKVENMVGEKIEVREDSSRKFVQEILGKFPGSKAIEIE
ncbi:MAG: DNA polymerase III subunit gamma/tau [Holosporales bacterium]|jgi:DNA polymerase-3 subunit gamma/tau|nr:DNA polymerase III subunit gamma/tau [Holosporales bacterium]